MTVSSYAVGAQFTVEDRATPTIRRLGEEITKLDRLVSGLSGRLAKVGEFSLGSAVEKLTAFEKQIGTTQKRLTEFGKTGVGGLVGSLGGIADKLAAIGTKSDAAANAIRGNFQTVDGSVTETGRKLEGLGLKFAGLDAAAKTGVDGIAGNLGRADGVLGATTEAAGRLTAELRAAGAASRDIPRLPGGGGGGHPRPGRGGGSGHGGHPHNTYGSHGAYVDAGMFGMIGGHEIWESFETTLHRGMELAHVQEQMRQAGIADADIGRATSGAWKEARAFGLPVDKVLGDIKELVLPFGTVNHAIDFIDPLEKMRVVLNAVSEGRGNESSEAVYKMARAGELKGLNNAEDYLRYFDGMTKAISASGGKVTPNSFAQVTQYGKLASQGWSEDFYTKSLPTLMQTMNPSTAGQSLMSLFSTLISGAVSKRSFEQMDSLGLIGDRSKIQYEMGKYKGLAPGAIVGTELLSENPLEWTRQYLSPLLEKKYGDLGIAANKNTAIDNLGGLFGNRNSAAAIAELALRVKSFDRDKGLIQQAHGIDGADALLKNDPATALNNFSAAWTNMTTALGLSSVSTAVSALNSIAGVMNRIGELAQAHPDAAKNIEGVLGGVAVGLGALAAVGLAAFLPQGIAIVAITSLTGALAGFAAVHWDQVSATANAMGLSMDNFHRNIADISGAFDQINAVLTKFFTGLLHAIQSIPVIGPMFGAEREANANPSGAPLTPEQKAWMESHPGMGIPADLAPSIYRSYKKGSEAFGPNLPQAFGPSAPVPLDMIPGMSGFLPMAYKTTEGMGQLGDRTGLVNIAFTDLDKGVIATNDNFATLGQGSAGFRSALDILTATAIGAARALAQVALSGGMGGGGNGLINASWGGGGVGGGFGSGVGDPINPGQHGWWTMNRQAHAVNVLMKGGVSELGAKALVSRWMNVEASGGPSTVNSIGAVGIFQALGARKNGLIVGDFDNQLQGALRQLHGSEGRALGLLNSGSALGAATGASQFERAEGYNPRTGMDNFTARTLRGMGAVPSPGAMTAGPPPRKSIPGSPASAKPMVSAQNDAPQHHHIYLDGKKIAQVVTKHQAAAMRFPTDMGGPDPHGTFVSPATPVPDAA